MLTGDAKQVAEKVAQELGISRVYSELLPEDKVTLLEKITQQKNGNEKVLSWVMASMTRLSFP